MQKREPFYDNIDDSRTLPNDINSIGLRMVLTLKFESYSQMLECFEHLESMIYEY